MRLVRLALVLILGAILTGLAIANRGLVSVQLIPRSLAESLGGTWSVQAPLFLIILLTLLIGMLIGMIWEWLREAGLRSESNRRAAELAALERETGHLRTTFKAPKDDVLAIIDAPKAPPPATAAAPVASLPAKS